MRTEAPNKNRRANDMRTGAPDKNRNKRYENRCSGKITKKNDMRTDAPRNNGKIYMRTDGSKKTQTKTM